MNAKVTSLPSAVVKELKGGEETKADTLLREIAQTLLNNLLLKLDLSPLRAERSLYGSLSDHFVIPQFRERKDKAEAVGQEEWILRHLCEPGARRVVHGGAGVGKTTCGLWLQSRLLLAPSGRLAILIRLRGETDIEEQSLLNLLKKQAGAHLRDALTGDMLRGWHEAGKIVVILDGFDEIPEARRNAVEKWIKDLGTAAKRSSLIVTSRPLQSGHLEELPMPWQQWDLLPFDETRIIDFIRRWHRYLPDGELSSAERQVDAASLARTFLKDPSLKPLADTPLMLGTLLYVHHRDKKLPSGRVDLYERYIGAMLGLRDSGLGIEARSTRLTDKQKRRVLSHVALHFHWNGVNEVNDETMLRLAAEALEQFNLNETPDCLLPALCERTGLIQGPGAWSFMHKTIGEFLVAELICDGSTIMPAGTHLDRKELWQHRHEDPWTAVLFFWAGKTPEKELEQFAFELVEENGEKGPLLALALLGDQGERLHLSVQRNLAMKILSRTWNPEKSGGRGIAPSVALPSRYYRQIHSALTSLRGLSHASDLTVFAALFRRGVISPEIIHAVDERHRDALTISIFWAMGGDTKVAIAQGDVLKHIPRNDLALYTVFFGVRGASRKIDFSAYVAEWLTIFPEGEGWLIFLLLGIWRENSGAANKSWTASVGRALWDHRTYTVNDEWLRHSLEWRSWNENNCGDVLEKFRKSFRCGPSDAWGLSDSEHQELICWLDALQQRRGTLATSGK